MCEAIYGDFDLDGDVDQSDFGHFQQCLNPPGVTQLDASCIDADLNFDHTVNASDFIIFNKCMTGPDHPADPNCAAKK